MLIIQGTIRIAPERLGAARPAMRAMVEGSRAEDGCLTYAYAEDVLEPGLIHVVERWRDAAALAAHARTEHFTAWRAAASDIGIRDRNLLKFDAGEGSPV